MHYANPAAAAQAGAKFTPSSWHAASGTVELLFTEYRPDAGKPAGGQGFTDNEVTLAIDGRLHILAVLTAQRLPEGYILLEMAPMDNQRRPSQSNRSTPSKSRHGFGSVAGP